MHVRGKVALAVVAMATCAGSASALAWGQDPAPGAPAFEQGPEMPAAAYEQARRQHEAQQALEERPSSALLKRRLASRKAFAGLGRAASLRAARTAIEPWTEIPVYDGLRLEGGDRLQRYTDEFGALVVDDSGEQQLVISSLPMQLSDGERMVDVDLGLERTADGFASETPIVPVTLGDTASEGVQLPDAGVTIAPAAAGSQTATLADDTVVWPGAAGTDADFAARPLAEGAQVLFVLRSAQSPESLPLDVDVPAGARLVRSDAGGVEVRNGDEVVARISATMTFDADGKPVPSELQLRDGRLSVSVPHRKESVRYPLTVDPVVEPVKYMEPGSGTYRGWTGKYFCNPYGENMSLVKNVDGGYGFGLYVALNTPKTIGYCEGTGWTWQAPGQTRVTHLTVAKHVNDYSYWAGGLCSFQGITDAGWNGWQSWTQLCGLIAERATVPLSTTGSQGNRVFLGTWNPIQEAVHNYIRTKYADIQLTVDGDVRDPYAQSVTAPTGWAAPTDTITVDARDDDLGVASVKFEAPNQTAAWDGAKTVAGTDCRGYCTQQLTASTTVGNLQHTQDIKITITDAVGRQKVVWKTIKVDKIAPDIELSEFLFDAAPVLFKDGPYELAIDATDENRNSQGAAIPASGASKFRVYVKTGSAPRTLVDTLDEPCVAGGCPLHHDWAFDTFQYPLGEHRIVVEAEDAAGNVAEKQIDVDVKPRATGQMPNREVSAADDDDGGASVPEPDTTSVCGPDSTAGTDDCNENDLDNPWTAAVAGEGPLSDGAEAPLLMDPSFLTQQSQGMGTLALPPSLLASGWGVADQRKELFTNDEFEELGIKRVRLIVPWDVMTRSGMDTGCPTNAMPGEPATFTDANEQQWTVHVDEKWFAEVHDWVKQTRGKVWEPLIVFERTRMYQKGHKDAKGDGDTGPHAYDDTLPAAEKPIQPYKLGPLPTAAQYECAVKAFRDRFKFVKLYAAWNEPNFQYQPTKGVANAKQAGKYWRKLNSECKSGKRCHVLAGEFWDSTALFSGYLRKYKEGAAYKETNPPKVWSIHPYVTATRPPKTVDQDGDGDLETVDDFSTIDRYMAATESKVQGVADPKIWLTEAGGRVHWHLSHGAADQQQAVNRANNDFQKLMRLAFYHPRIVRYYHYQVPAVPPDLGSAEFDSSLLERDGTLRESYCIFYEMQTGGVPSPRQPCTPEEDG